MGSIYQNQAQFIAWVKMILSSMILVLLLLASIVLLSSETGLAHMVETLDKLEEGKEQDPDWGHSMDMFLNASPIKKLFFLAPSLLYFIGEIWLAIYLLQAAQKLDYKKLRLWFNITATALVILTVLLTPALLFSNPNVDQGEVSAFFVIGFLFTGYSLFVVHQLKKEIKTNSLPRTLQNQNPYAVVFPNYPNPDEPMSEKEKEFMKI